MTHTRTVFFICARCVLLRHSFFLFLFVLSCPVLLCFVLFFIQEEGGSGVNYKGSVDVKAELGRTQSKVRVDTWVDVETRLVLLCTAP